ncbi:unnamed protein product [Haemonchus placei]|uniref:G_PROTEIN_RECEP_F1_2 domain-containing protein n=1 Tax=Haemonchus placei TaxID=6290 RepID=A0A0N4X1S9_HAEPC|nr:unnamed protein product [Haemonchus placei]
MGLIHIVASVRYKPRTSTAIVSVSCYNVFRYGWFEIGRVCQCNTSKTFVKCGSWCCSVFADLFASRRTRAVFLIALSWVAGTAVAILPLFNAFGFAETESSFHATGDQCYFTKVVDYRYLVYVIFVGTILAPTLLIVFCYVSIYSRIRKEEHQIKCLLRKSERDRRMQGRRRLIKILLILVVSYGICWYPLYVINSIDYFLPEFSIAGLTLWTVVLSHMSCALNPLIYAYGMPGFKKALREFFNVSTFQSNTGANYSCYMKCSDAGKANQNQSDRIRSYLTTVADFRYPSETVRKISAPTLTEVYKLMRRRTIDIT